MKPTLKHSALFVALATVMAPTSALLAQDTAPSQAQGQPAQLDAIRIQGRFIPEPMLDTSEVASFVTSEDLERTGDSTAAAALTRVSGLTMTNDKFVNVRGLNERYTSAMFNGSPLPSPEPMQRVVPLDLFPTDVLSGITVQKTYSAKYPGEFGGGVIDMQSLSIPRRNFFSLSLGTGGNSATTGNKGLTYYGSDTDFWGYDDGTRKMPAELRAAVDSRYRIDANSEYYTLEQVQRIGRSLQNANLNILQENDRINPDVNFGFSGGYVMDMGEDAQLGLVAVAGFENEWRTRYGQQRVAQFIQGAGADLINDYDFLRTTNNARVNVLLGAGYEFGDHKLAMTTLYVHDTSKVAASKHGLEPYGHNNDVRYDNTSWFERTMLSNQLTGAHHFGEYGDFKVEWRLASSNAKRNVPYENEINYRMDGLNYWQYDAPSGGATRNSIGFSNVEDKVQGGGIDFTYRLPFDERDVVLSAGFNHSKNQRNAEQRLYGFAAPGGTLPFYNRYQRVDYLFSDYNISQDLFRLIERTQGDNASAYDAQLTVDAAYVQAEIEFSPVLRATVGGRYERATQWVQPYNLLLDFSADVPSTELKNNYFLPALTVTWNMAENQQVRFGASQTLARPQFRELAYQEYTDPDSGRTFTGNPYLVDSKLRNLDLRYEWFFEQGEHFTAALFHKNVDKPVESAVRWTGSKFYQTYFNAPRANLLGLELEVKKYLTDTFTLFNDSYRLFANANYTWSKGKLQVNDGDTVQQGWQPEPVDANLFVIDNDDLQGQSTHIGNLTFGLESPDSRNQAMLVVNHVSDRISARTEFGQPDYMEKPGTMVDLVLRREVPIGNTKFNVSLSGRNLLNTDYREYQQQGDTQLDVHRYVRGRSYSLGVSVNF